jgi:hypothetical protein
VIAIVIDTSIALANGVFGVLPAITGFGWEGQPRHWALLLPWVGQVFSKVLWGLFWIGLAMMLIERLPAARPRQ